METVQSLLPRNSTAQAFISVFINITHFILDSGQGKSDICVTVGGQHVELSLRAVDENSTMLLWTVVREQPSLQV